MSTHCPPGAEPAHPTLLRNTMTEALVFSPARPGSAVLSRPSGSAILSRPAGLSCSLPPERLSYSLPPGRAQRIIRNRVAHTQSFRWQTALALCICRLDPSEKGTLWCTLF